MKTNFERFIFTIIGIFIFQISICQENYIPGYIVPLKGDTLHGFIDYRNWERNPDKIFFKEKLSDEKTNYTPIEIIEFGVLDEIYESAIIETEISPDNTNTLESNKELKFSIDTAYLQTMIKGSKCLYYYKNKIGKSQFYIKNDSTFELLIYKKYLKEQEGMTVIAENRKYLGQLSVYLQDCPTIQSKLEDTKYSQKSMENLFYNYYNCTHSEIVFQRKTPKISIELGVLAGLSITSLNFTGEGISYITNTNYQPSMNFSTGLFLDLILPRNQGKWSICNELVINSYKINGSYNDYVHENQYTITHTTIGYSHLKINNMLRYKYPVKGIFIYLNAGFSNGFAISESNYKREESTFYDQFRVEEGKALDEPRKHELGYILGLGSKFKKYSFEIRYEKGNGMSDDSNLKSTTNRYFFLFGYRF